MCSASYSTSHSNTAGADRSLTADLPALWLHGSALSHHTNSPTTKKKHCYILQMNRACKLASNTLLYKMQRYLAPHWMNEHKYIFLLSHEISVNQELCLLTASYWLLALLIFQPWKWKQFVPSKYQLTFTGLHNITSQKAEPFSAYNECTIWRSCPSAYAISRNTRKISIKLSLYYKQQDEFN